jgi:heme/copper-type cytochrome/quinol oxidase subunit 2
MPNQLIRSFVMSKFLSGAALFLMSVAAHAGMVSGQAAPAAPAQGSLTALLIVVFLFVGVIVAIVGLVWWNERAPKAVEPSQDIEQGSH